MTDSRDQMDYDVVVVGGGPAGLSFAIRLKQLNPDTSICLLEKGTEIGAHTLSGAVMEPGALAELLPDWKKSPPSICVPAREDEFSYLTKTGRIRLPTPPQMKNEGNFIISLGSLCRWLAEKAEESGVDVFPGFPVAESLYDDSGRLIGVRCNDMGRTKDGQPGPNYAPGVDIHAKLTVLAEGCRGSITKANIAKYGLDEQRSPQTYGLGLKELWRVPKNRVQPGLVQHTVGWPLDHHTYGGSFLYHLNDDQIYVGFVTGLDYDDPMFSPFEAFQQFKEHPTIRLLLEGGEIVSSGARTIVEGGWQSMPKMELPGGLIIGDAGGTLNVPKIKGIHMAIRSAMVAAEHYAEHQTADGFDASLRASSVGRELHKVRNIRPGFQKGLWAGLANAVLETVLSGHSPWTLKNHADWNSLHKTEHYQPPKREWLDQRTLAPRDRLASVYYAQTAHDELQPVHLHVSDPNICTERCAREYANPCTRFCPAGVYEIVSDEHGKHLQINAANCVHCKACDIKDPYQIITWTTPEGGSGPTYRNL